jgi:hypothetical protein
MIRTAGALSVRSSHGWSADAARFDERSLVSCAGLVPVWSLAGQTGLVPLLARVRFRTSKVRSGAVNPAGQAGLCHRRDDRRGGLASTSWT